jgi:hypothetical protein
MNRPAPEVHEALAEVPVQQRAVDAIRQHEWDPEVSSRGWTRHDQHNFHAFCEVCSGNVEAMVKVLADAGLLADHFAEAVTEARARELREVDTALRIEEQRAGQRELTDRNAYLRRTVWTRAREIVHARADSLAPVTSVESGCTCGGMAACQQCQDRDSLAPEAPSEASE